MINNHILQLHYTKYKEFKMNNSTKSFSKKILLGMVATTLLTTTVFAYGGQGSCSGKNKQGNHQNKSMMKKGKYQNNSGRMMKMMSMLNLTDKQKQQVQSILQENVKSTATPYDAFTDKNFDKAKFIKIIKEKREQKIEQKAEMIAKVYEILTPAQKKDLKTILDMKKIQMKKRGDCNGQNCNGRR